MPFKGNRTSNAARVLLLLAGGESLVCLIILLFSPLYGQRDALTDFPFERALSIFVVASVGIVCLWAAYTSSGWVENQLMRTRVRWPIICLGIASGFGCGAALDLGTTLAPAWQPMFMRGIPLIIWAGLISLEAAFSVMALYRTEIKNDLQADLARPHSRTGIGMLMLGLGSMLVTCLVQVLPSLIVSDTQAVLHIVRSVFFIHLVNICWLFTLFVNLIAAVLFLKKYGQGLPRKIFLVYWFMLAAGYILLCGFSTGISWYGGPLKWDVFYLTPDSITYVIPGFTERPPLYPLFIQALTQGRDLSSEINTYPLRRPIKQNRSELMKVAKAQKVLVLAASMILCGVMMAAMRTPLPAVLFLWLYNAGYFSPLIDEIIPETMVASLLFLLLAVFIGYLQKPRSIYLLLAGLLTAALYMTRLAAIFTIVIPLAMIFWGWLQKRWRILPWAGLTALLFFFLISVKIIPQTNLATSSKFGVVAKLACFSLQVAKLEDIPSIQDEKARMFLERALPRFQADYAYAESQFANRMDVTRDAIATCFNQTYARTYAMEITNGGGDEQINRLLWKVVLGVTGRRFFEYVEFTWQSFAYGAEISHFKPAWILYALILCILIESIYIRGWLGYASALFMITHVAHLMVITLFDLPSMRYVWATEILLWLAIFMLGWALFSKIITKRAGTYSPGGMLSSSS